MSYSDPLKKTKDQYQEVISKIKIDSPFGIDAQLTHAYVLDYLQQIVQRLEAIEQKLNIRK